MKIKRQDKILEIVVKYEVETQDDLIEYLRKEGFNTTQATISRDIRELKLAKVLTGRGTYRYMPAKKQGEEPNSRFNNALVESIRNVDYAGNVIVLKTFPGLAPAVATGIDSIRTPEILGCVAGDDTIFVVTSDGESAREISEKIKHMMRAM